MREVEARIWPSLWALVRRGELEFHGEALSLGLYRPGPSEGSTGSGEEASSIDIGVGASLFPRRLTSLSLAFEHAEARYGDSVIQAAGFLAGVSGGGRSPSSVGDGRGEPGLMRLQASSLRAVGSRAVFTASDMVGKFHVVGSADDAGAAGVHMGVPTSCRAIDNDFTVSALRMLDRVRDIGVDFVEGSIRDGVAEWRGGHLSVPGEVLVLASETGGRSAQSKDTAAGATGAARTALLGQACKARTLDQDNTAAVCLARSRSWAALSAVGVGAHLYDAALKGLVDEALRLTLSGTAGFDSCSGQVDVDAAVSVSETRVAHTRLGAAPLTMPAVRVLVDGAFGLVGEGVEKTSGNDAPGGLRYGSNEEALPNHKRQQGQDARTGVTDADDGDRSRVASASPGLGGWTGKSSGVVELGRSRLPFGFELDEDGNLVAGLGPLNCQEVLRSVPVSWLGVAASLDWQGDLELEARLASGANKWPVRIAIDRRQVCRPLGRGVAEALQAAHYQRPFVHTLRQDFYADGKVRLGPGSGEHWSLAAMSGPWVASVLAHEDAAFFRHGGISISAIEEAFRKNAEAERIRFGGSTLTMQLAKNLFLPFERTLLRKFQEWLLTTWIESAWRKEEVLELYLNIIELGPHLFGSRAAAHHYFRKTPAQLTWAESALLALALPSPRTYGPRLESDTLDDGYTRGAQRFLSTLAERNIMTAAEYAAALTELDRFASGQRTPSWSPMQVDAYNDSTHAPAPDSETSGQGREDLSSTDERLGAYVADTTAQAPALFMQDTRLQCRFGALPASRCRARQVAEEARPAASDELTQGPVP